MTPRPPAIERDPQAQGVIDALDADLAKAWDEFVRFNQPTLTTISTISRRLDELRPEWKGCQYRRPNSEIQAQAADNFFNS